MPVRLSVIMVQTATSTANAQRLAEALVGELIGRPGIDLALLRPLHGLDPTCTDRLMLEAIAGDVAVLAWQPVAVTLQQLQSLDFTGERALHAFDPQSPVVAAGKRRVYGFNLNEFSSAVPIVDALYQLQSIRQVKTHTIGACSSQVVSAPLPGERPRSATRPHNHSEKAMRPGEIAPWTTNPVDLDDLLDQLDRSDP